MRHLQTTIKLNRDLGARQALIRNLLVQFYQYGSITTTQAKAKLIKPYIDRLISKAKNKSLHARRQINSQLNQQKIVETLINQISTRFPKRNSGYIRIIKLGRRTGDNSMMVKLKLLPSDTLPVDIPKLKTTPKTKITTSKTKSTKTNNSKISKLKTKKS